MKLSVDASLCDGNGLCVVEAPEVLVMKDQDIVHVIVLQLAESQRAAAERAVRVCPKAALRLIG